MCESSFAVHIYTRQPTIWKCKLANIYAGRYFGISNQTLAAMVVSEQTNETRRWQRPRATILVPKPRSVVSSYDLIATLANAVIALRIRSRYVRPRECIRENCIGHTRTPLILITVLRAVFSVNMTVRPLTNLIGWGPLAGLTRSFCWWQLNIPNGTDVVSLRQSTPQATDNNTNASTVVLRIQCTFAHYHVLQFLHGK